MARSSIRRDGAASFGDAYDAAFATQALGAATLIATTALSPQTATAVFTPSAAYTADQFTLTPTTLLLILGVGALVLFAAKK